MLAKAPGQEVAFSKLREINWDKDLETILDAVAVLGSLLLLSHSHCAVALVNDSANALFLIIPRLLYKSELICVCGNSYTILEIGFVISLIFTGNHLFFIL